MLSRGEQLWSHLGQWSESPQRFLFGDVAWEALRDEHLDARSEVEGDLVVRLGFDAAASA